MTPYPYLSPWLQCLLQLAPPRGLIHVGAGGGSASDYPFANTPRLLTVEADANHCDRLQAQLQSHPQCQLVQALVAGQPGNVTYYTLSQSNESGLCPPINLQALWPNIKTLGSETSPVTTLQILLDEDAEGFAAYNWAMIDCLPAGEVLLGAGKLPESWDVVVVRVLKEAPNPGDPASYGMSLPALRTQLSAFGLEFVAMEEENHPQVVRALFVRNPSQQLTLVQLEARTQIGQLNQEKSQLIADNAELARTRDELAALKEAEAQAKSEAITLRDLEAQAKTVALQQRDALIVNQAALTAARDEHANLASERQAALTALQTQRDNLAQEKYKLIADYEELEKSRDELASQFDTEAKAKAEALSRCDAEAQAKAEALAQCELLAKEQAALTAARDEQENLASERQAALTALQIQRDNLAQEKSKLKADNAELARARDELSIQLDTEAKAKAEALSRCDAEALAQCELLAKEQAALAAARDEQANLATERQAALTALQTQRDSLAQEKSKLIAVNAELARARDELAAQYDTESKAKAEALSRCDAEAKAKAEAIAQCELLAKEQAALAAACDEQAKLATDRQLALSSQQQDSTSKLQRIQQLEADNHEYGVRQQMLQEELIKAEAQIELIKDLLLREPGL